MALNISSAITGEPLDVGSLTGTMRDLRWAVFEQLRVTDDRSADRERGTDSSSICE